ncbi:large subunit ribosomal protein L12e [Nematocida homosporus]|uniref:large subunit ribosomal protein L12e n=1 Tax=Nematocida homosporus TaxID=1912981 RepID=UPI00221E4329|nr:large subunit ribosomal protein L12e [Nematocida homosporus]KAI5185608.1 large subunit ribosomal protein L12e [Nematocida homosporus]
MNTKGNDEIKQVRLRVVGGEPAGGASLAQKVGPLGFNAKQVGENISKETKEYKGYKIGVLLTIQNRQMTITPEPGTSALVLKALQEPPRDRKKVKNVQHNGSVSLAAVIEIAKKQRSKSLAKHLSGVVKEVLGSCLSVGCLVDGESPKEITRKITAGEISIEDC